MVEYLLDKQVVVVRSHLDLMGYSQRAKALVFDTNIKGSNPFTLIGGII